MSNYPCKGCRDRELGCHSTCERYNAVLERKQSELKDRVIAREIESYLFDSLRRYERRRRR